MSLEDKLRACEWGTTECLDLADELFDVDLPALDRVIADWTRDAETLLTDARDNGRPRCESRHPKTHNQCRRTSWHAGRHLWWSGGVNVRKESW
jgi:hypothetical protein